MKLLGVIACLWGTVLAHAETRTVMPPLEEIVVQTWLGIDQGPPHGVYRLVIKKDGTGRLWVHEGVAEEWEISRWILKGTQLYLTIVQKKDHAQEFTAHGVVFPLGGSSIALRTRVGTQVDLPEKSILLLPERRVMQSIAEAQEKK